MEPQQAANPEDTSGKGSFLCRQSSTRWTPTTEQIRILKDLYYNSGVRSPNAEEIQKISARLRQYGKIEGKNVFYWFQNYKARERQKKRFITNDVPMQRPPPPNVIAAAWRPDQDPPYRKYQNITSAGISTPSPSSATYAVQEMGHHGEYGGSFTMEKSFRDCAISSGSGGGGGVGGSISYNLGWVGVDPYASSCTLFDKKKLDPYASSCNLLDKKKSIWDGTIKEEDDEEEEAAPNIETLSLFPMHAEEDMKPNPNSHSSGSWYGPPGNGNGSSWASLELSLNSYNSRAGSM